MLNPIGTVELGHGQDKGAFGKYQPPAGAPIPPAGYGYPDQPPPQYNEKA